MKKKNVESICVTSIVILSIVLVVVFMFGTGCSDGDSDGDTQINQCEQTAEKMDQCIDLDAMGTTLIEMKDECKKEGFDTYDRCLFDCAEKNSGCDSLVECWDNC